ncbi:MAG: Uma2 family endonuclease [Phycisphaerae bacterium]
MIRRNDELPLAEPCDAIVPHPGRLTESQFEAWCTEDVKAEWVDGEVILMSPSNYEHVTLDGWLLTILTNYVEEMNLGVVLGPEFMIRLSAPPARRVPDLIFIAQRRRKLIRQTYFDGPPDLVVEIVSPDSTARDWRDKFIQYEANGVREYWVFDPAAKRFEAYTLSRGRYIAIKPVAGRVASRVVKGFFVMNDWLAGARRPKVGAVLKVLGVRR